MNREQKPAYSLTITCEDKGDEPEISTKFININVGDINDNPPVFTQDVYPEQSY